MELPQAYKLALELMHQHGLDDWSFQFDRAHRRFGCCHKHIKRITLSFKLVKLNSENEVRDTILHEIAHAISPTHGHGADWKRTCLLIGANPKRCFEDDIAVPQLTWKGLCVACNKEFYRARKPRVLCWHKGCGDSLHPIIWKK